MKQAPLDVEDNKYLSHYDLMLLENIIDIIHDVVAEGVHYLMMLSFNRINCKKLYSNL